MQFPFEQATFALYGRGGAVVDERIYLGGFEIYKKGALVRETLHIMDDKSRIALVESAPGERNIRYRGASERAVQAIRHFVETEHDNPDEAIRNLLVGCDLVPIYTDGNLSSMTFPFPALR